ncbi:unnamed protein product [Diatraea saccharalis]|uniref:GST C-terminal domain-containing protein n=1 Tax=Diatraea saccharalis TaxID=40085 RepID=A0A9N9R0Q1_9NEOP|nr:unnamed protein product [Diatraea saccharalis]
MPAQPIKLYYLPPSPPCRAVMMTAKALGLELELVLTNIMEGAHLTPEFIKGPMLFKGEPMDEALAAKLNEAIGWLNTLLDGKAFVAGDNLTVADISIIVTFTNLAAFEYDFSEYENVKKWFERTKKTLEPYGYYEIDDAGAQMLASFLKNE